MRNFLLGVLAGLILATFAPSCAGMSREGFDLTRSIGGQCVEKIGEIVQ